MERYKKANSGRIQDHSKSFNDRNIAYGTNWIFNSNFHEHVQFIK